MTAGGPTLTSAEIGDRVTAFLTRRLGEAPEPGIDIFARGLVSSMFAMELVVFLEGEFDVEIVGSDLKLDNFRTVPVMTALVERLAAEAAGD